MTRYDRIRYIH